MVLGRYDDAHAHFEAAVEIEERMGYVALAARSRLWWARVLLARGRADDHVDATRLLHEVSDTAERLGLGLLAGDTAETTATAS